MVVLCVEEILIEEILIEEILVEEILVEKRYAEKRYAENEIYKEYYYIILQSDNLQLPQDIILQIPAM